MDEHHGGTAETVGDGSTRMFGPRFVHDVRNSSSAPAVSVQAHSPPRAEMTRYELAADGLVAHATETQTSL